MQNQQIEYSCGQGGLAPSPGLFQAFLAFTANQQIEYSWGQGGWRLLQGSFRPSWPSRLQGSFRPSWPSPLLAEPADRIFLGAGGLGPFSWPSRLLAESADYFWGQRGWGLLQGSFRPSCFSWLLAEPADRIFLRGVWGLLQGSFRPSRLLAEPADRIFLRAGGLAPSPGLFQAFLAFTAPCRTSR